MCAEDAITEDGAKNATARNIAARAGYTAGTLYTCFQSLDELLIQVQVAALKRLRDQLSDIVASSKDGQRMREVTRAYVAFALDNQELWVLIQQDRGGGESDHGREFAKAISDVRAVFGDALASETEKDKHASDLLWATTHGLTGITISRKLAVFSREEADRLAVTLASRLAG
jgi:AcrR family transcriptional regulator